VKPNAALAAAAERSLAAEWLVLVRPRVGAMVFLVACLGALLARPHAAETASMLAAALCITAVAAAASIFNQVLERETDALMERTRARPLVTGRIQPRDALLAGSALGALGTLGLALGFNLLSALLAVATLVTYVAVYTPMKRVSTLNTVVGALPGAAPPLLGYVALAGETGPWAWVLFGVLFAWQFPHFMAIAWLYREDYARAGHQMLPALPGARGVAGSQALLYGLALVPVSLLPLLAGMAHAPYAAGALVCGLAYLAASLAFALREERRTARALVLVSLAYLPLFFASILFDLASTGMWSA